VTLFGGNRSVKVGLSLDPAGYRAGLAAAGRATRDWAKAADQSIAKHRRSWDDIGGAAAKAGLVIGAGAAAAVVSFARFDQSMSRAQAGTMATRGEMDKLREAALQAGADTQYSATEAADAITAMGKAGVGTNDILSGGLTGALSLAAAGELEVGRAAEVAATAMTQFGLTGKDLPHVADLLAAGAGKAQGSVDDLANALKYVGPVAKSANVPIEETVGVLAELASQGIISEQAGTSIRGVLMSLRAPSKAAAKAMDEAGISVYDANGRFIGLGGAAQQLQEKLGGLSEQQRDVALGQIFGNEQITAATILMQGGGKAVADWTKKVNDSGYASKQAGMLMNNLAGDVEQLKGSLETALISGGGGANQGLRQLTQGATSTVNAFMALPDPVQHATVVVAGLTAGALLLTAGVIKGAIAVKTMRTNLAELGVTGERTRGIMGGVGKGVAAIGTGLIILDSLPQISAGLGIVGDDLSRMQLELANYAKGADLAGDSAKRFGKDLKLPDNVLNLRSGEGLKDVVKDLSGANGWWKKDVPLIGSDEADQIKNMGKALAGLASSGQAPAAAAAFDRLSKSAGLNADETRALLGLMPEYNSYLSEVAAQQVAAGDATAGTADATSVLAQQMQGAGAKAGELAKKLDDVRKAARDMNDAFLEKRSTARDFQQALDDAQKLLDGRGEAAKKIAEARKDLRTAKTASQKKSAQKALDEAIKASKDSAVSLDVSTEAGRRYQSALDAIASSGQAQADGIAKAGGSDAEYRASLEASRRELIRYATAFGMPADKAKALADDLLRMPTDVDTEVRVNGIDAALDRFSELTGVIATVNGRKVVITTSVNSANLREDRSTGAPVQGPPVPAQRKAIASLPKRALGGPVVAGREYWVGERGPERFRPSMAGVVLPHQSATAPAQVVRVPVRESVTRRNDVHLNGPITVVAPTPSRFTSWASTQQGWGSGGVG
jgi:TP901 family phage tail tape measure protein